MQTYKNWELIIIDDGSTDNTEKIIDNFNESRIIYNKLEKNQGRNYARKHGVKLCNGNFISFLDSDDVIHNEKLTKQIAFFHLNPTVDIVLCNYQEIRNGKIIPHNLSNYSNNCLVELLTSPGPVFHSLLINCQQIGDLTKFMTDIINEWDFLINLAKEGMIFISVNEYLADWIVHENSISNNTKMEAKNFQLIVEKHKNLILKTVGIKILSDHYRRIARLWEKANDFQEARKFYKNAFFTFPFNPKNIVHFFLTIFGYPKLVLRFLIMIRKIREKDNEE